MIGWTREMTWPQTGLSWYPTSPNIPHFDSVAGYPMTGLGAQMGKFKHGIGTEHPFRFLTYEGKTAVRSQIGIRSISNSWTCFSGKNYKKSRRRID